MVTRYKTGWELYDWKGVYGGHPGEDFYGDCGESGPMEEDENGGYIKFEDLKAALSSIKRYSDDGCGDNDGGDCGLCGYDKEHPKGQWIKFEDVKQFLKGE